MSAASTLEELLRACAVFVCVCSVLLAFMSLINTNPESFVGVISQTKR